MRMQSLLAAASLLGASSLRPGCRAFDPPLLKPGSGKMTDADIKASREHDAACRKGRRAKLRGR